MSSDEEREKFLNEFYEDFYYTLITKKVFPPRKIFTNKYIFVLANTAIFTYVEITYISLLTKKTC